MFFCSKKGNKCDTAKIDHQILCFIDTPVTLCEFYQTMKNLSFISELIREMMNVEIDMVDTFENTKSKMYSRAVNMRDSKMSCGNNSKSHLMNERIRLETTMI